MELAPPFVTYQSGVTLWVDDLPIELSYVGQPAHTTNDSLVWVPNRCTPTSSVEELMAGR